MTFKRVKSVLALIMLSLLLIGGFTGQASASHAWGNYHWARTSNPFTVKLGRNLTGDWPTYLNNTAADWSRSSVLDTIVVNGTTSPKTCKPRVGRVEVCNSKYGNNGWLGIAQIWINGDHITQGVVKLNDTYMQRAPYNTPDQKNHVMCQEVGHTLGLGHQSENGDALGTCMDYSMDPGSTHPNDHDYEELETIYTHLDSTTTLASSSASSQAGAEDRGNWGARIHRSENGRSDIYVRSAKNGQKVVTFVNLVH